MSFDTEDKLVAGSVLSVLGVGVIAIAVGIWKSGNAPIEDIRKVQAISVCTKDAIQEHLEKAPLTRFDLDSIESACNRAKENERDRIIQKGQL